MYASYSPFRGRPRKVNIEEMQVETSRRDKRFEKCAEKKIRCKVCSGLIYAKMSGNYQWKC